MDDFFYCAVIAAVAAVVGFVGCKVFVAVARRHALNKECMRLAEAAKATLEGSGKEPGEKAWETTSIDRALADRDKDVLLGYANLLGSHGGLQIALAVIMTKKVKLDNPSTALSPESLTAEQVTAFYAVRDEFNLKDEAWHFLDSAASQAGAYAMERLNDYPLVLSIVNRGITDLDEIKTVLAEMKATKTVSLSEGML